MKAKLHLVYKINPCSEAPNTARVMAYLVYERIQTPSSLHFLEYQSESPFLGACINLCGDVGSVGGLEQTQDFTFCLLMRLGCTLQGNSAHILLQRSALKQPGKVRKTTFYFPLDD